MNYATIFQVPALELSKFFDGDARRAADELIRRNAYKKIGVIETELDGAEAAEEMFDLSNNPCREEERKVRWGANRSLSVGDVVFVNDRAWLCANIGWEELA